MDGRIRWIAQRLIDFLHVPSSLVEKYLSEERTQFTVNEFFTSDGPPKLMFFYQNYDPDEYSEEADAHTEPTLFLTTGDTERLLSRALYFLRVTQKAVDVSSIDSDIVTGTVTHSGMESLESSLCTLFLPVLKAQDDWGLNPDENTKEFLYNLQKFSEVLSDSVGSLRSGVDLAKPERKYEVENKQPAFNRAATDPEYLAHYEYVLEEWCRQVEKLIQESDGGRKEGDESGPNTELEYWKNRLSKLNSITEQLKTKECKIVLGVCMAAKSKLLRKWKSLDNQITDVANEAKDNVKYLSTLEKYTEPLYSGTPQTIVDALPALLNNVKMIHTIARFYSTSDRMTTLFYKITNQMINVSKTSLNTMGKLWDQDPLELVQRIDWCIRLNESYQEQYHLTKDKLLTQPKGKQFDFNEQIIFGRFDSFCRRLSKLVDVFSTVQQFDALGKERIDGMDQIMAHFDKIKQEFKSKPFDLLDFGKPQFDRDYVEFNRRIQELEARVQTFINRSFESIGNTEQALNLLKQFQSILQRENLKADLDEKYMTVFANYGAELESVQRIYEKFKQSPLIVRNAPPVAGNIAWARQLLRRIE